MANNEGRTVMYVAKDLRSVVVPDCSPGGPFAASAEDRAAFGRMYPPCVWVRFAEAKVIEGDAPRATPRDTITGLPRPDAAVPAWLLTPALLAFLWRQDQGIHERLKAAAEFDAGGTSGVAAQKAAALYARFDRIMEWANAYFPAGAALREVTRQRRGGDKAYTLPVPPPRSHSPQVSLAGEDGWIV